MERKVHLLGASFSIRSSDDSEHLTRVLEAYIGQVEEIKSKMKAVDPLKIAILAGLNIADQLVRKTDAASPAAVEMGKIASQLIETIDQRLTSQD
jgi:cell division protein ZapA